LQAATTLASSTDFTDTRINISRTNELLRTSQLIIPYYRSRRGTAKLLIHQSSLRKTASR
jgi:hypothetical protein